MGSRPAGDGERICPFPPYGTTLNETLTEFTAVGPGRATIIARVNPAYPNPPPMPGFPPPQPFQVTVVVAPWWVPWAFRVGFGLLAALLVVGTVVTWRRWNRYARRERLPASSGER